MEINFNGVKELYWGDTKISKAYYGDTLLWEIKAFKRVYHINFNPSVWMDSSGNLIKGTREHFEVFRAAKSITITTEHFKEYHFEGGDAWQWVNNLPQYDFTEIPTGLGISDWESADMTY